MYSMVNLHVISLMSVGMGKYGYFPPMQFFASFSTHLPMDSGIHFNMHYGVFSQDLAKSRSRKIGGFVHCTPLKFHRHLGNTATKTPVTFQINRIILNVISRFHTSTIYPCIHWPVVRKWTHKFMSYITKQETFQWNSSTQPILMAAMLVKVLTLCCWNPLNNCLWLSYFDSKT